MGPLQTPHPTVCLHRGDQWITERASSLLQTKQVAAEPGCRDSPTSKSMSLETRLPVPATSHQACASALPGADMSFIMAPKKEGPLASSAERYVSGKTSKLRFIWEGWLCSTWLSGVSKIKLALCVGYGIQCWISPSFWAIPWPYLHK